MISLVKIIQLQPPFVLSVDSDGFILVDTAGPLDHITISGVSHPQLTFNATQLIPDEISVGLVSVRPRRVN